jgi:RNA polymerase sigma factor (sigma-70 family)
MCAEDVPLLLRRTLDGDRGAVPRLVAALTPIVQARVARTLLARRALWSGGRSVRQEVEDLSQEVFLALFVRDARVLRSWQPERGLSLPGFVGMIAERQALSFLRNGRRNPRQEIPYLDEEQESEQAADESGPEQVTASRECLGLLLDRLREELSPLGWRLFELLFVHEQSLAEVRVATGLSDDAVYAWRSRLRRQARKLLGELSGSAGPARRPGRMDADERG